MQKLILLCAITKVTSLQTQWLTGHVSKIAEALWLLIGDLSEDVSPWLSKYLALSYTKNMQEEENVSCFLESY